MYQSVALRTYPISDAPHEIRTVHLRSFTEIAQKSPFLYVNSSPIWLGFHAGAKATVQYTENTAQM